MKDILVYVLGAAVYTALMYPIADYLPVWAQLTCNTILIAAFVGQIIRCDLPLSSIPVIGKLFRKSK